MFKWKKKDIVHSKFLDDPLTILMKVKADESWKASKVIWYITQQVFCYTDCMKKKRAFKFSTDVKTGIRPWETKQLLQIITCIKFGKHGPRCHQIPR
jgi:hypothetical protein